MNFDTKELEEIKHLRAMTMGMSLTIGILHGMICGFRPQLTTEQAQMLDNIDKNIHLMFYNHVFEVKK
jgi:hypothetical protein